jgi:hypothetical protein
LPDRTKASSRKPFSALGGKFPVTLETSSDAACGSCSLNRSRKVYIGGPRQAREKDGGCDHQHHAPQSISNGLNFLRKARKDSGELQHEFVTFRELCRFTFDQQCSAAKTALQAQYCCRTPLAFCLFKLHRRSGAFPQ